MAGRMEGQKPQERKGGNRTNNMSSNITGNINRAGKVPAPKPTAYKPRRGKAKM